LDHVTNGVDYVIHLAAAVRIKDPDINYNVNFIGTKNLVESCKKNHVKRIVYMSTVSAVRKKRGPYGSSKRKGEKVIINSGMEYTIFRPPLIYGLEGQGINNIIHYIRLFPFFIPIIGSGKYTRQPVSVEDVARITVDVLENKKTFRKIYPLAGPDVIKFRDFVKLIAEKMNIRKKFIYVPLPICTILAAFFEKSMKKPLFTREHIRSLSENTKFDISTLKDDTSFNPVKLEYGIEDLVKKIKKKKLFPS
ncbi:MAG: NAD-dependent epimerase/dehydratase family protein, partial [Planctomycetes bacterium]|nr:NAD-dependent epimerase/dehydratase family protein [Planctomycetota bacterium]